MGNLSAAERLNIRNDLSQFTESNALQLMSDLQLASELDNCMIVRDPQSHAAFHVFFPKDSFCEGVRIECPTYDEHLDALMAFRNGGKKPVATFTITPLQNGEDFFPEEAGYFDFRYFDEYQKIVNELVRLKQFIPSK